MMHNEFKKKYEKDWHDKQIYKYSAADWTENEKNEYRKCIRKNYKTCNKDSLLCNWLPQNTDIKNDEIDIIEKSLKNDGFIHSTDFTRGPFFLKWGAYEGSYSWKRIKELCPNGADPHKIDLNHQVNNEKLIKYLNRSLNIGSFNEYPPLNLNSTEKDLFYPSESKKDMENFIGMFIRKIKFLKKREYYLIVDYKRSSRNPITRSKHGKKKNSSQRTSTTDYFIVKKVLNFEEKDLKYSNKLIEIPISIFLAKNKENIEYSILGRDIHGKNKGYCINNKLDPNIEYDLYKKLMGKKDVRLVDVQGRRRSPRHEHYKGFKNDISNEHNPNNSVFNKRKYLGEPRPYLTRTGFDHQDPLWMDDYKNPQISANTLTHIPTPNLAYMTPEQQLEVLRGRDFPNGVKYSKAFGLSLDKPYDKSPYGETKTYRKKIRNKWKDWARHPITKQAVKTNQYTWDAGQENIQGILNVNKHFPSGKKLQDYLGVSDMENIVTPTMVNPDGTRVHRTIRHTKRLNEQNKDRLLEKRIREENRKRSQTATSRQAVRQLDRKASNKQFLDDMD